MKGAEERKWETVESDAPGPGAAIIGMAGRFPGAKAARESWNNLKNGIEGIS
jgi:acyl transferase domain-containing protein